MVTGEKTLEREEGENSEEQGLVEVCFPAGLLSKQRAENKGGIV